MELHDATKQLLNTVAIGDGNLTQLGLEVLALGAAFLECEDAFFIEVQDGKLKLRSVLGPDGLGPGTTLDPANTLCNAVVQSRQIEQFTSKDGICCRHVAMPNTDYNRYLGAPLLAEGRVIGILSFASRTPGETPFSAAQVEFARLAAGILKSALLAEQNSALYKRQRDALQFVLNQMPTMIWVKDDQNIIKLANRAAAQSMGVGDPQELENTDTYKLFPEIAAKYHEDDLAVINSGTPRLGIVEPYLPEGGTRGWVSTDKIPFTDENGERGVVVVSTDITATMEERE